MGRNVALALVLVAVGLVLALNCNPSDEDSASSEPNELHPNTTGPDEQGESGSLIEPARE